MEREDAFTASNCCDETCLAEDYTKRTSMRRDNEAERGASIRMRMPEAWNAGRA
jgi:hypothetical protein